MDRRKKEWWNGPLALGVVACLFSGTALTLGAQDTRLVINPTGTRSIYIAPPGAPPAIVAPYVQSYPYRNQFIFNASWQVPQGKAIKWILNDNIQVEWSGNYFNARVFKTSSKTFTFDVDIRDDHQNIVRGRTPTGFSLKADWPHLPVTETFHIKGVADVELDDGTTAKVFVDEKTEFYFHGSGSSAPFPTTPGGAPVGNSITVGIAPAYEFVWRTPGMLVWTNSPIGEVVVDRNVPGINRVKVESTPSGPVVVYQTGTKVRYKMLGRDDGRAMADGEVGSGTLTSVDFRPGQYGTKAKITIQDNQQTCHHMFTIDRWGKAGTTKRVGRPLCSGLLQQWQVQFKSVIYLFEFDPRTGTLTCSDNYKGWKTVVDTGIDGLIVPAATGGGGVVVYNKGNTVFAGLLFWIDGKRISHFSLGSGRLLGTIYTKRGSYGAEGTATIRTGSNSAKDVDFCIDMWGKIGCNRVRTENPGPPAPFPPDPPPGFPGAGGPPSDLDSDGDGFSDEYEIDSGTDPHDPNSYPKIDLSIVLLIDKSGSMGSQNKMEDAKQAAISALSRINLSTEVGVMAYSGGCNEIFPIVADFSQNTAKLTQKIQTITAGGGTPMSPALLQARKFLWEHSHGKQGLIILLCDGQNSCPPNEADAASQIFQRIISNNRLRVPGAKEAGRPLLSFLVPKAYAGTQDQADLSQAQPGGADDVPPGQAPPETIPDEGIPGDSSRGGIDVPPPGVVPPQNLDPVLWVPPYGTAGVNTAVPAAQARMPNQQMPIQVSTIGFGLQNQPEAQKALVEVAKAGGGQAFDAQNLQELTTAFTQAITGQPTAAAGGGGAPVVSVVPSIGWPIIIVIALAAASLLMLIALVLVKSRRSVESGKISAGLDIVDSDGGFRSYRIRSARTAVGRNPDNDLVLPDPEASGRHAEIAASPDGFFIRDLGSANGTFVRGERVSESRLYAGDEVIIGRTRILLKD